MSNWRWRYKAIGRRNLFGEVMRPLPPPWKCDSCGAHHRIATCHDAMPTLFESLAVYNAERARGLVHTPEWDAKMQALQSEFDGWLQKLS